MTLIIAVIALVIGLISMFLAMRGQRNVVRYTLSGSIELNNDCDGQVASLPVQVVVKASLNDNRGQASGGSVTVSVAPDPADPPGTPRKIGTYSVTVAWGPGLGNPSHWDSPVAALTNGQDVCQAIPCPAAGSRCLDMATRPRIVPFVNPTAIHDIRVQCSCR